MGGKRTCVMSAIGPKRTFRHFPPPHIRRIRNLIFRSLPEPKKAAVLSDRGCNLGRQLFGGRGCWQPASNNVHAAFMAPLLTWLLGQELWNPTGSIGIVRSRE